jgi:hypothetical protein
MQQYAVTVVFYVKAEDEDHAQHIVDNCVWDKALIKEDNESWSIVDTTEVKF